MELDSQLCSILRVPQVSREINQMVVLQHGENDCQQCEHENGALHFSRSSENCFTSTKCVHAQNIVIHTSYQTPSKPPSEETQSVSQHKRKLDIGMILRQLLLIVYHMVQWHKISQTSGVSAECIDEDLD